MVGLCPITHEGPHRGGGLADEVERGVRTGGVEAGVEVGLDVPPGAGGERRPRLPGARSRRDQRVVGRRSPAAASHRPAAAASPCPRSASARSWSDGAPGLGLGVAHHHQAPSSAPLVDCCIAPPFQPLACLSCPRGPLMIIGGAEDKLRKRTILKDFVAASGGRGRPDRRHPDRLVPRPGDRRGLRGAVHQARRRPRSTPPGPRRARTRTTPAWSRPSTRPPASS